MINRNRKASRQPLERLREEVYRCVKCGACQSVCPTYRATGDEARVARGRLSLVEALLDGSLSLTRGFDERISSCIGCLACEAACPGGIGVHDVMAAARAQLVAGRGSHRLPRSVTRRLATGAGAVSPLVRLAGAAGSGVYAKLPAGRTTPWSVDGAKRALPALNPRPLQQRIGELTRAAKPVRRVALFAGCSTSHVYPETGEAAVKVLGAAGFDVIAPASLGCCGTPFLSLGDEAAARRAAEDNLRVLGRLEADAIVTTCSSCALALREAVPDLLGREREDVMAVAGLTRDIHELLADGLDLPLREGPAIDVVWHDPCHMRFGLGLEQEPRAAIARLDGVQLLDLEPGCCGGAGVFSFLHYDLSLKVGLPRAEEIAATGAGLVATGCPGCRTHLTDVLRRVGADIKVVHTLDLIAGPPPGENK